MKKVLLAFDDPGGGLVVSSLLEELMKVNFLELEIYSGKHSEKFLIDLPFKKMNSQITKAEAEEIIDAVKPDILVTATGGGNAEQELRNIASERSIKSIVILDFWKDYKRRWKYASYEISEMKDIVCVMDEFTKLEMAEEGFPENCLKVTGHAYLDKIFNSSGKSGSENSAKGITEIGKNKKDKTKILFLSQPLNVIGIHNYKIHPLDILLSSLKDYCDFKKEKISLIIKPHPLEIELDEMKIIVSSFKNKNIDIVFSETDDSLNKLISDAEIIIGYNTIAMFESRALNKRTISLNVVPVNYSLLLAMRNAGIEITGAEQQDIYNCLTRENRNKDKAVMYEGAIQNIVQLILKEINLN